jgi:hypothetical protein
VTQLKVLDQVSDGAKIRIPGIILLVLHHVRNTFGGLKFAGLTYKIALAL